MKHIHNSVNLFRRLGLGIALACTGFLSAQAQKIPTDSHLITGKLDNGLTYYVYPNKNPKGQVIYRLFVKAGSVVEEDHQRGLAHFLEHIAFSGTTHFPGNGVIKFLESHGAKFGSDINAHTSLNETVFKLQLPNTKEVTDTAMTIIADWMTGITLEPQEVEKERGIILSERLTRNTSKSQVGQVLLDHLLNGSHYADRMTIGDSAIVATATPQVLGEYYRRWYQPQLMAIAVVGDVNPSTIVSQLKRKIAVIPRGTTREPAIPLISPYKKDEVEVRTWADVKENTLDIIQLVPRDAPGFKQTGVATREDYTDYLMRRFINQLCRTRFERLSFSDPAYKSAEMDFSGLLGATGVNMSSVKLVKGKMRQGIMDFIAGRRQILDYGFTATEIEKMKKTMLSNLKSKAEKTSGRKSSDIIQEIYSLYYDGNVMCSPATEYAMAQRVLEKVDSSCVLKRLRMMNPDGHVHYLLRASSSVIPELMEPSRLTNDGRAKTMDSVLQSWIDSALAIPQRRYFVPVRRNGSLCEVPWRRHIVSETALPELQATDVRLDNGTRVIFRRSTNEKERFYVSGFRKGGLMSIDSVDFQSALVGHTVIGLSGVGDMDRDTYNYFITDKRASMRMVVDKYRCGVLGSSTREDLETMFQQLYTKWTLPRLDTVVARMTIDKLIESYQTRKKTPRDDFKDRVDWLLNGRDYGNRERTDQVYRDEVHIDRMIPTWHRLFGPAEGFTFVIMGDCEFDEIRHLVEQYIGALPAGKQDTRWRVSGRNVCRGDTSLVCVQPGASRATVQLIWQSERYPMGYSESGMMNSALKAVLRNVLLQRLREDMSKVYSVSVSVSSTPYPSPLSRTSVSFVCKPSDVKKLSAEAVRLVNDFVQHPEAYTSVFADVQRSMAKDQSLLQQGSTYWLGGIRNFLYFGDTDWSWLTKLDEKIGALTVSDVAAYAGSILQGACRADFVYAGD